MPMTDVGRIMNDMKYIWQVTNYDMLAQEDPIVSYNAHIEGISKFIENNMRIQPDLRQGKNVHKVRITINNMPANHLTVPYLMVESSKKVEKLAPGFIHIQ